MIQIFAPAQIELESPVVSKNKSLAPVRGNEDAKEENCWAAGRIAKTRKEMGLAAGWAWEARRER